MDKFYGPIGFAESVEVKKGVWKDEIIEKSYYGDVIKTSSRLQSTDQLNDNVNISNQISIISDPYANGNFLSMRYIEFMEVKWKITNVEVRYPRLILSIGGVYNGG